MENRNNHLLMGIIFIVLGSSSYGMLSTFVKLAYKNNYTTAEVTVAQFALGALIVSLLALFQKNKGPKPTRKDIKALMIAGIPMSLTSVLYYLAVRYIDASVGVVLLMQSVWMGVILEAFQNKKFPTLEKIFAVIMILFGTLLATKMIGTTNVALDPRGIILGLLTAMSFTWTLNSTSRVANHMNPIERSKFMLYGGCIIVATFAFLTQIGPFYLGLNLINEEFIFNQSFNANIFISYGFIVTIFGTVIPPIMLNKGFPIVGVGLGSILSSIELPVAMVIAFLFLGEIVNGLQWVGVVTILSAIILLNYRIFKK
jgi:drug/metabolite transporter (DMT)-like permease